MTRTRKRALRTAKPFPYPLQALPRPRLPRKSKQKVIFGSGYRGWGGGCTSCPCGPAGREWGGQRGRVQGGRHEEEKGRWPRKICVAKEPEGIGAVKEEGDWEEFELTVGQRCDGHNDPAKGPCRASRSRRGRRLSGEWSTRWRSASTPPNLGEKKFRGVTEEGSPAWRHGASCRRIPEPPLGLPVREGRETESSSTARARMSRTRRAGR